LEARAWRAGEAVLTRAQVDFEARGFGRTPKKDVTITLTVAIEGLPFDALEYEDAKELLARMAIKLTSEPEHEQLARELARPALAAPPKPARRKLERVK
jgi:hypothetical protein